MLHTKFRAGKPSSSGQKILSILYSKHKSPRHRADLDPLAAICSNLVKVYQAMFHIKFQISQPCGSEEHF